MVVGVFFVDMGIFIFLEFRSSGVQEFRRMLSFFKKLKGVIGSYRFAKKLKDGCLTRKCLLSPYIFFYLLLSTYTFFYFLLSPKFPNQITPLSLWRGVGGEASLQSFLNLFVTAA